MKTYLSILRGINVSGQKMIRMEALRAAYEALGFKNVSSYIQSGNLIFQYKQSTPEALAKKITQQIKKEFGFDVPVVVLDAAELQHIATNNPFKDAADNELYVTFLSDNPAAEHIDKLATIAQVPDEFIIKEKAIYLFIKKGYGNTKLSNNYFEQKLKVVATTRNWKTVQELLKRMTAPA